MNIYPIDWEEKFQTEITAIYKMFKDQESRIFSLDTYSDGGDVMDILEQTIKNDRVFVVENEGDVLACFVLEDAIMFGDMITEVKLHCAIRRPFWGPQSRVICNTMRDYINKNYVIKKMIAEVPQCKYGIIKLLKDIGFKHEGTLKECLLYLDKNNKPKWYDKLIYTLTRKDI